ncbi:membrane protein insertase YidC [Thermodesulfobacteriota bacterium]
MEKRLLLAVVLSFVVVFASSYFTPKNSKPVPKKSADSVKEVADTTKMADDFETSADFKDSSPSAVDAKEPQAKPAINVEKNLKEITVNTDLYTATFTNYGARLKSLKLNKFKVDQSEGSDLIDLVTVKDLDSLPLDIHFFTTGKQKVLTGAEIYSFSTDNVDITKSEAVNKVIFSFTSKSGFAIQKTYTFSNENYNIDLDVKIKNLSQQSTIGKVNLNWIEAFTSKDRTTQLDAFAFLGTEVQRSTHKDLEDEEMLLTGDIKWSGLYNKFFMVAFVPEDIAGTAFYANKIGNDLYHIRATTGALTLNASETTSVKYKMYMGPKMSDHLKKYEVGLQGAIDYGFFSIIAIPIMELLKIFYKFTKNYGLAIILLTVLIKILFYPLTQKSYKAMKDMQKISPLMAQLKEKYKNDKERLNREVIAMYKKHKVNPVGGCFPMLLQMPVFFALYKVLLNSVELRHAPFFFWITDLSSKDPYYITPVIMGLTMLIQQRLSPSSADKAQQKIMLLMPIVFTFMFANFAAGLVIYWLVNNVLSIAQQAMVLKKK